MKSLKEELCMYSENLSEKTLPYIDELKHRYDKWEKDLCKLDGTWVEKKKHKEDRERQDIEQTEIDEKLYDAVDEFADYKKYKEEFIVVLPKI